MSSKHEKRRDALDVFIESVLEPDSNLRSFAHENECFNELMEWRQEVIDYLELRRQEEFS